MAPTAPGRTGSSHPGFPSPILPPLPHCPSHTCTSVFPRHILTRWFSPEMFPCLACLENSYSYEKAPLALYSFVVSPDSAKQSVWFSLLCSLRTQFPYTVYYLCPFSFSRPCPLEAGGTVRSERWRALLEAPSSGEAVTRALTLPGPRDTHREGGAALGLWSRLPGWRPAGGPLSGAQGGLGRPGEKWQKKQLVRKA